MPSRVREATASDADAIGRTHHASWVEAYSRLLPEEFWQTFTVGPRIERWRESLENPTTGSRVVVAEVDGEIVGHAMSGPGRRGAGDAYPPARDIELYSIYVLAANQGSGLAQQLLDAVIAPSSPAQLWVFEDNPRARAFYERNGFRADGVRHVFGARLAFQPEVRLLR